MKVDGKTLIVGLAVLLVVGYGLSTNFRFDIGSGGFLVLSISKPNTIDSGSYYLVNAQASGGGQLLEGFTSKDSLGANDGKQAKYDLTVDAQKTQDACSYTGSATSNNLDSYILKQSITNYWFDFDAINFCLNNYGNDAIPVDYGGTPARVDCYQHTPAYRIGLFDQQPVSALWGADVLVKSSNGNTETMHFGSNKNLQQSSGDGVVTATWAGNSVGSQLCPSASGVLEADDLSSQAVSWKLVDKGAYQNYPSILSSFNTCILNQRANAVGLGYGYRSGAVSCITALSSGGQAVYNSAPNTNSVFGSSSQMQFDSTLNKITVNGDFFKPNFQLRIRADWLGIRDVSGIPTLLSCSSGQNVNGGSTAQKTISIRNTGGSASFYSTISCANGINVVQNPTQQQVDAGQQASFTYGVSYPGQTSGSGSCTLNVYSFNNPAPATCAIQDSWTQLTRDACNAPFTFDFNSNHCVCPLSGQTPPAGQRLDANSCTFVSASQPTPLPTQQPPGDAGVCPLFQTKSSITQGGFNIPILGNLGGTQVVGCQYDFGLLALIVVGGLGVFWIYSRRGKKGGGKIALPAQAGQLLVPAVIGVLLYAFFVTSSLGSLALAAGVIGFIAAFALLNQPKIKIGV